ncbi:MAG: hypothetical protein K0S09_2861 [Sphingobacteriaceae bacterium]|jgi:hypothetical protein|nr:hypothetical protein [Sphingobacteriaceae bacterium]
METYQKSELQNLYELNRHHLSDINFFDDEAKFIKNTLEKFFLPMLHEYHVNRAQLINKQLTELNMMKASILRDLTVHRSHLEGTIKDVGARSIEFLKLEGERMQDEIRDLNKRFIHIKREVYAFYKKYENSQLIPELVQ